jgi:hypothetical protein
MRPHISEFINLFEGSSSIHYARELALWTELYPLTVNISKNNGKFFFYYDRVSLKKKVYNLATYERAFKRMRPVSFYVKSMSSRYNRVKVWESHETIPLVPLDIIEPVTDHSRTRLLTDPTQISFTPPKGRIWEILCTDMTPPDSIFQCMTPEINSKLANLLITN